MELEILFLCVYFNAVKDGRMLNMFMHTSNTSTLSDLQFYTVGWSLNIRGCAGRLLDHLGGFQYAPWKPWKTVYIHISRIE